MMTRLASFHEDRSMEVFDRDNRDFSDDVEKESNSTLYTDRMIQYDNEKYVKLCEEHFGREIASELWGYQDSEDIENFISDWVDEDITFIRMSRQEKLGRTIFRLDFYSEEREQHCRETEGLEPVN